MFDSQRRIRLAGTIAGAGFESGDRFVVGVWTRGPLGPMSDVMWAAPGGERRLLVPGSEVGEFVGGVYRFERVEVVPFDLLWSAPDALHLRAGPLELELEAGSPNPIFSLRPKRLRRAPQWVEFENRWLRPLVGRFLLGGAQGVDAVGLGPAGVREWYCIDSYRPVTVGRASIEGQDLGALAPLEPPVSFGLSEFPRAPALVGCAPLLEGAARFLPST